MKNYREIAEKYFTDGYNCAQAVFLAFSDELGVDADTAVAISAPFGGGMGRLREVCGAVSGMFMALGCLYGKYSPDDAEAKKQQYADVQQLAHKFEEINGSIICRELLGLDGKSAPTPEKRTSEYYKKRPCKDMVGDAAEIFAEYLVKSGKING